MQKVLTAEEMREVDRQSSEKYGIPSILLMENAAHAAARVITEKLGGSVAGKSFLILCGKGSNGGDGAALARILWTQGARIALLLFGKVRETTGDAKINFEIFKKIAADDASLEFIECNKNDFQASFHRAFFDRTWNNYDAVVDAMFGTGLNKPLDENFAYVVDVLCDKQKWKQRKNEFLLVSLDIPSGLNADTPEKIGEAVRADITVTFTAPKLANVMSPASSSNGELYVAEIGSRFLLNKVKSKIYVIIPDGIRGLLCQTQVQTNSYKNTRGTALIIAGSKSYAGAAVLAANACFAAGAGMVSVAVPNSVRETVAVKVSEEIIAHGFAETVRGAFSAEAAKNVLPLSEKMHVVALGCGLTSDDESTRNFVREVVGKRNAPTILDADGLNALAPFDLKGSNKLPLILTPHIGEFQRLVGKKEIKNKIEAAREFSQKHHVILLLKGERSLIASPDGNIYINPTGNAGIARAGSGDTLTGIVASFLAQTFAVKKPNDEGETNLDLALQAIIAALYISGLAGDIAARKFGQRLMSPTDVRKCLGEAINLVDNRESISVGENDTLIEKLKGNY